ncbi:MAG: hypothetical protein EOM23_02505 [Candidatus Moranbacteria bacterium]|nr:hypothetical protein [Candidatus Moranbacteria bacterium]
MYIRLKDEIEKISATNIILDSEATLNRLKDFNEIVSNNAEGILKRTLKSNFQTAKETYDSFKQGYILNVQYTPNMNLVVIPEFTHNDPNMLVAFTESWNRLGVRSAKKFFKKYFEDVQVVSYEEIELIENE